jgi:hypothetical protein
VCCRPVASTTMAQPDLLRNERCGSGRCYAAHEHLDRKLHHPVRPLIIPSPPSRSVWCNFRNWPGLPGRDGSPTFNYKAGAGHSRGAPSDRPPANSARSAITTDLSMKLYPGESKGGSFRYRRKCGLWLRASLIDRQGWRHAAHIAVMTSTATRWIAVTDGSVSRSSITHRSSQGPTSVGGTRRRDL